MNYILQIFTGGWIHSNYSISDIKNRISYVAGRIPVEAIIIGWNLEKSLYCELGKWLKTKKIKMILWLPVLSEVGELVNCKPVVDLEGKEIQIDSFQSDEKFEFYCPSEKKSWQACIEVYERYFEGCGFDGVFLDKIRTQTATAGMKALFSCSCEKCKENYSKHGVNLDELRELISRQKSEALSLRAFDNRRGFSFKYEIVSRYFEAKSKIISDGVNEVSNYFHGKNMEVGLDLFFPMISELVGQKYSLIAQSADFIKPMLYRRTQAPAGIEFEYKSLLDSIPKAIGYPSLSMTRELLQEQIEAAKEAGCRLYPGIEINYREDVARTDEEYVLESIETLVEADTQGAVLAWDVMLAPDNHIECISKLGRKNE